MDTRWTFLNFGGKNDCILQAHRILRETARCPTRLKTRSRLSVWRGSAPAFDKSFTWRCLLYQSISSWSTSQHAAPNCWLGGFPRGRPSSSGSTPQTPRAGVAVSPLTVTHSGWQTNIQDGMLIPENIISSGEGTMGGARLVKRCVTGHPY